jgi:hypothetical protein
VRESGLKGEDPAGQGRGAAACTGGHRLRDVRSGLPEDEPVAVRVAQDDLDGPWLAWRRAVERDAGSVQPLLSGAEVTAGAHQDGRQHFGCGPG